MRFVVHAPDPRLAGRLRYWRLSGERSLAAGFEPVLPDGCVEAIVHLGDPFRVRVDGREVLQPRVLLAGPGSAPVQLAPTGRVDVIGIRMEAGVAADLLELPVEELVDRLPELGSVAGALARGLAEELAEPRRAERWTDVLDRRMLAVRHTRDLAVEGSVTRLRASHGRVTIEELARDAGLSTRQLERRFRARVGLGPKRFARIMRFQRAWRLLSGPSATTIAAVAARTGYFDQAHLVRDFKQFAGEVPSRLLRAEHELAGHFTA